MSDYKSYVAYYLTGHWHNPITSVLADSPEMAQQRIEVELKKAGRRGYLRLWERDGRRVKIQPQTGSPNLVDGSKRSSLMNYEGKFRDFMVGWLAQQPGKPAAHRSEVMSLYEAIADAATDAQAFEAVAAVLEPWGARWLWHLSHCWDDSTVALARELIETLRQQVQADTGDVSNFYLFFLNPFKEGCVPDGFEDNLEREICWMFRVFYETAGAAALEAKGWVPYVVIEPSWEDASNIIVLAHPQGDSFAKEFVLQHWYKAWHLQFNNLTELAEELLLVRQAIADPSPTEFISAKSKGVRAG
jgi:hypothetical protein